MELVSFGPKCLGYGARDLRPGVGYVEPRVFVSPRRAPRGDLAAGCWLCRASCLRLPTPSSSRRPSGRVGRVLAMSSLVSSSLHAELLEETSRPGVGYVEPRVLVSPPSSSRRLAAGCWLCRASCLRLPTPSSSRRPSGRRPGVGYVEPRVFVSPRRAPRGDLAAGCWLCRASCLRLPTPSSSRRPSGRVLAMSSLVSSSLHAELLEETSRPGVGYVEPRVLVSPRRAPRGDLAAGCWLCRASYPRLSTPSSSRRPGGRVLAMSSLVSSSPHAELLEET
ncbi:hypothetical protein J6590_047759 [Homalodisca vitripennis]|nr:hypothetical protein J6590_047759 [Homalodisca vitripennis]